MLVVSFKDFEFAERALSDIPGKAPIAISRAINLGVRKARTIIGRQIRQEYNIRQSDVYAGIKQQWASANRLLASVTESGQDLPLALFSPRSPKSAPASAMIRKGQRTPVSRGFMMGGRFFKRVGDERYPIKPVFTRSVAGMLSSQKVERAVEEQVRLVTLEELSRQVNLMLSRKL